MKSANAVNSLPNVSMPNTAMATIASALTNARLPDVMKQPHTAKPVMSVNSIQHLLVLMRALLAYMGLRELQA